MSVDYYVYVIYGIRVRKDEYPQFFYSDTCALEEMQDEYPGKFDHLEPGKYDDYYDSCRVGNFIIHSADKQGPIDSEYFYLGKLMFEGNAIYEFDDEIAFLEEDTKYFIYENIRDKFGIDLVKDDIDAEIKLWIISQYS